jgi:hypothetical protein
MKRILFLAICLLVVRSANAQKSLLALNEQNKYIYYQVTDLPGISADSLYKNSVYFVKEVYPKTKSLQMSNTGIIMKDKFLTYSVLALVKHENGEIGYTLNIECKDAKYRYWLTDFVFTPYERNRYGVFIPSPGINIPLETAKAKIDKKELDGYLEQTGTFCQQLGEKLKKYMAEGHEVKKTDQPPAKIVTDKW